LSFISPTASPKLPATLFSVNNSAHTAFACDFSEAVNGCEKSVIAISPPLPLYSILKVVVIDFVASPLTDNKVHSSAVSVVKSKSSDTITSEPCNIDIVRVPT